MKLPSPALPPSSTSPIPTRYRSTTIASAGIGGRPFSDPKIQELLTFAAKSNYNNPGVRLDSVDLLTGKPDDPRVREALTYALRYDSNPGVRLKALDGWVLREAGHPRSQCGAGSAAERQQSGRAQRRADMRWSRCAPTAACVWRCSSWRRKIPAHTFAPSRSASWHRCRTSINAKEPSHRRNGRSQPGEATDQQPGQSRRTRAAAPASVSVSVLR